MTINPATPAISTRAVRKSFGEHTVLDGVDLTVAEGSVFSLLGPNGAGKTTMVRILSTLIPADAGDIRVGGHDVATDPDAVRALIGVTGQFSAVDNLLTGEENLRLMADLRHLGREAGRRRIAELLERFDLTGAARKPVSTYSGGMRRRLDLAMTLVGDPAVIFLDEPTTGLDPRSRRTMWQIIRELVTDGVTIFLTTQYLEEADQLADFVAVLDRGQIVAEGTPAELKRRIPGGHIQLQFGEPDALRTAASMMPDAAPDDEQLILQVPGDGSVASLRRVLDELDRARIDVEHLSIHSPDLDDVFFAVTGHPATEPTTDTEPTARHEQEALQR
jgi:ABC-2 type transport system ATP-binding protein